MIWETAKKIGSVVRAYDWYAKSVSEINNAYEWFEQDTRIQIEEIKVLDIEISKLDYYIEYFNNLRFSLEKEHRKILQQYDNDDSQ